MLSEENSLIAQENYLALKQAQLDAHKAIYDRIAHVLQPELEKQKSFLIQWIRLHLLLLRT